MLDLSKLAREMFATKRGVGMAPPFYAETASVKGDPAWPHWIVRNECCNSLGVLMSRDTAEALAVAMNEVADARR